MNNTQLYMHFFDEGTRDGAKDVDGYALSKLIEHSIRNKTYKMVQYDETDDELDMYDVIVVFNFAGDPRFGFYRHNDERCIMCPTKNGNVYWEL